MAFATSAAIVTDVSLPDGLLQGYDSKGALIVSLRYMPSYERLLGGEDAERAVVLWRTDQNGARRIAAITAWNMAQFPKHPTHGNA